MRGVKFSGQGLEAIFSAVEKLVQTDVLVGIPHGEDRSDSDGITNAQIGYILETGSPAMNLPARPHLARGVELVQDFVGMQLSKAVDAALDGKQDRMYFYLGSAGMKATMSVKALINAGDFEALSARTIAARKARGRKSEKPLVDTAQMRNAHTYVIMSKNEEVKRG